MPEDPAPARNDDHAGVASEAHDAARTDDPETGTAEDRGAAAERTRLAWRRTALSATGVGLLVARPAVRPGAGVATWLVAALAMAAWSVLTGLAYRRSRG